MNKEVKELIEQLKEYGDGFSNVLAPTEESVKALLDYINQLETNIDEAIKYIETHSFIDENLPFANALGPTNVKKLVEILERGKE